MIYEYQCYEKLKSESVGNYTSRIHWVEWGTETPKDRDEVNRPEV